MSGGTTVAGVRCKGVKGEGTKVLRDGVEVRYLRRDPKGGRGLYTLRVHSSTLFSPGW